MRNVKFWRIIKLGKLKEKKFCQGTGFGSKIEIYIKERWSMICDLQRMLKTLTH